MPGRLFTSESVTEGHPDKIADRISDTVLDYLHGARRPQADLRVAVETLLTTGLVVVAGEVRTTGYAPVADLVRDADPRHRLRLLREGLRRHVLRRPGRHRRAVRATSPRASTTGHEARVGTSDDELDTSGAGDQGLMFGYACDDTDVLMPLPIVIAQRLAEQLTEVRKDGTLRLPASRRQDPGHHRVRRGRPPGPHRHRRALDPALRGHRPRPRSRPTIKQHVIDPVLADLRPARPRATACWSTRPAASSSAARWATPASPAARSSSTPTAAWPATAAARSPARTRRRSTAPPPTPCAGSPRTSSPPGLARRCEVQVAYAIGKAQPVGVFVETFGTGIVADEKIQEAVLEVFDLRPAAIIRDLDLLRPIYAKTSAYGHFGRELPEFTWERTDRADALKAAAARSDAPLRRAAATGSTCRRGGRRSVTSPRGAGRAAPGAGARRQGVAGQGAGDPGPQGRAAPVADGRPGGAGAGRRAAGPPRPHLRLRRAGVDGRRRAARGAGQGAVRRPGRRRLRASSARADERPPRPAHPAAPGGERRAGAAAGRWPRWPPTSPSATPACAPTCCGSPSRRGTPPPRRRSRRRRRRAARTTPRRRRGAWADHGPAPALPAATSPTAARPRAVWAAAPGDRLADAGRPRGRGDRSPAAAARWSCVPDGKDVARVDAALTAVLGAGHHVALTADAGPARRYRDFLAVARGARRVVVGTRAAAFAPVARPRAGGHLGRRRRPARRAAGALPAHPRDAAAARRARGRGRAGRRLRAQRRGASTCCAPAGRTSWPRRASVLRSRVTVVGGRGRRARARPRPAWPARPGCPTEVHRDHPRRPGRPARCSCRPRAAATRRRWPASAAARRPAAGACAGPLALGSATAPPTCRWCGTADEAWACPECGHRGLRAPVLGEARTAEELGRAFPGTVVRTSGGDRVLADGRRRAGDRGRDARAPSRSPTGGYAAVVLLDTWLLLGLRRPARRRGGAAPLGQRRRPWSGPAAARVVVGDPAHPAVQALVRWDPAGFAAREADAAPRGPPAAGVPAGHRSPASRAPSTTRSRCSAAPTGFEVLGPVAGRRRRGARVVRVPRAHGAELSARARRAAAGPLGPQARRGPHPGRPADSLTRRSAGLPRLVVVIPAHPPLRRPGAAPAARSRSSTSTRSCASWSRTSPTPCSTRPAPGSPRRRSASGCGSSPGTSTARSATWSTRSLDLSEEEQDGPEGCLSIPELTFDCRRALSVVAKGFDMHGEPVTDRGLRAAGPGDPARDRPPRRRAVHRPARRRDPQGGQEGDPRGRVVRRWSGPRSRCRPHPTGGLGL